LLLSVQNLSSVGIIHRATNPGEVLIETKTPGYPRIIFVGKGLLPGGNWVGKAAANDGGPLGTYLREINEELSFGNSVVDPDEMDTLFGSGHLGHPPEKHLRLIEATLEDKETLFDIKDAITVNVELFGVFLQDVPKWVFNSGDPENKAGDYRGAVSVFSVPLPDKIWFQLVELQARYGNLSNESQTFMTSAEEIVEKKIQIGWGQDRVLQKHFLLHGIKGATKMSLMAGISSIELIGYPLSSYHEYLQIFDIQKIPDSIQRLVAT